jgi:LDH2 family malate/lactate/ureidoglycolate dehydrogenase
MAILGPESVAGSTRIPVATLTEFSIQMFLAAGLSAPDAATAAAVLINADLRGVWSHGVIRLPMYVQRLQNNVAKARPNIQTQQVAHSALSVDGDHGLGLVVAPAAMSATIKLAKQTGIAVAGVKNSGHFGAASYYLQQAIDEDCILYPFRSYSKRQGTNQENRQSADTIYHNNDRKRAVIYRLKCVNQSNQSLRRNG